MARFSGRVGRPIIPILNPGHPGHPGHPGFPHWGFHHHDHGHWVFRFGRWIVVDDVVEEAPAIVTAPAPGPCTCLTKNYTPSGLVVFADVCTKESASASVYCKLRRVASADNPGRGHRSADDGGADHAELRRPHL